MSLTPKNKEWVAFGCSLFFGAFLWIASPLVTGHQEPWDSPGRTYQGLLFFGGLAIGLSVPRRFWLWGLGILLGQIIGFTWCVATSPEGGDPLMLLGLFIALPLFSLFGLVGSFFGTVTGKLFRKLMRKGNQ